MTARRTPVGRPRSSKADDAILRAALEILAEGGFQGLRMEAVAARSGVAKTTIYRRWRSKKGLAIASLKRLQSMRGVSGGTDLRSTLVAALEELLALQKRKEGRLFSQLLFRMIGEVSSSPALLKTLLETAFADRINAFLGLVRDAEKKEKVELRVEPVVLLSVLAGAFLFGTIMGQVFPELDVPGNTSSHIVDGILHGFIRPSSPGDTRPD